MRAVHPVILGKLLDFANAAFQCVAQANAQPNRPERRDRVRAAAAGSNRNLGPRFGFGVQSRDQILREEWRIGWGR